MTNEEIIKEAQRKIIQRGDNPYYPVEQHLKDADLIEDLTKLKVKYKDDENGASKYSKDIIIKNRKKN